MRSFLLRGALAAVLVIVGTAVGACGGGGGDDDSLPAVEKKDLEVRSMVAGDDSKIDTGLDHLVIHAATDANTYRELWGKHAGGAAGAAAAPPAPKVDFKSDVVLGAFRTGGPAEKIEVTEVVWVGGALPSLVVTVRLGVPSGDCTFPESELNHFEFVAIERPEALPAEPKVLSKIDQHEVGCKD